MLVVETIAKIRRAYFKLGKPIKEICRELRVSRKVVRKVIRSDATEFRYERSRQPLPRIGPWHERLEGCLEENERLPSRQRLTIIRIYEDLVALGYAGSYAAVRRYAIAWREKRASATADAYVPLTFAPGEAYQFDWSHEIFVLDGGDDDGESRSRPSLPQPHDVCARLSAREKDGEQILLAGVVRVECRAPDVRTLDDVLDRHRPVTPLQNQRNQRFVKRLPRSLDAAVLRDHDLLGLSALLRPFLDIWRHEFIPIFPDMVFGNTVCLTHHDRRGQ